MTSSWLKCLSQIKRFQLLRNGWYSKKKKWKIYFLRVFGLLSSLLFPQRFGRYALLQVFVELGNLYGTSNYVLYRIHGGYLFHNRIEPATLRWLTSWKLREPTPITVTLCVLLNSSDWIFGTYKLNVLTWLVLLLLCMIFFTCAHIQIYSRLAFLIIGSHIVFISILGLLSRSL